MSLEQVLPPEEDPGFRGILANRDAVLPPGNVIDARNIDFVDGRARLRRGVKVLGNDPATAPADGPIQGGASWEQLDGSRSITVVADGVIRTFDFETESWAELDPSAVLVPLSDTAPVMMRGYRGSLIITDRVNRPIMADIIGPGVIDGQPNFRLTSDTFGLEWDAFTYRRRDESGEHEISSGSIAFNKPNTPGVVDPEYTRVQPDGIAASINLNSLFKIDEDNDGLRVLAQESPDRKREYVWGLYVNDDTGDVEVLATAAIYSADSTLQVEPKLTTQTQQEEFTLISLFKVDFTYWGYRPPDEREVFLGVDDLDDSELVTNIRENDQAGAGVTLLSGAPIAGGVGVYYDKIFFYDIPGAPNVMEWSLEADPTRGYSADFLDWEFVQTDASGIRSMAFMNNLMNVFKARSTSMILGSVEDDFSAAAVREGVSETDGSIGRFSTVVADGDVYTMFVSGPRRVVGGQRMIRLEDYQDATGARVNRLRKFWEEVDEDELPGTIAAYDREQKAIMWALKLKGREIRDTVLVYYIQDDAFTIHEYGFDITAMWSALDDEERSTVYFGDSEGRVWLIEETRTIFDDSLVEQVPIEWSITSRQYGRDTPQIIKRMAQVKLTFDSREDVRGEMGWLDENFVVGGEKTFAKDQTEGEQRYDRGFNKVAPFVGWHLSGSSFYSDFTLRSATTILTAQGSERTIG